MTGRGAYAIKFTVHAPWEEWMSDGICHLLPPHQRDWFYPKDRVEAQQARGVCFECPVQVECLDYALRNGEEHGVWGGASPDERKSILAHHAKKLANHRRSPSHDLGSPPCS